MKNPAEHIKLPKAKNILPKNILPQQEAALWLDAMEECYGLFGRAVGELFYGTGLRVSEVKNLKTEDVNLTDRMIFVQEGKRNKDRVAPIPDKTARILQLYLRAAEKRNRFFQRQSPHGVSLAWYERMCVTSGENAKLDKHITPISSGTASPLTFFNGAWTSGLFRSCWVMKRS